jgi:hypothetical protein
MEGKLRSSAERYTCVSSCRHVARLHRSEHSRHFRVLGIDVRDLDVGGSAPDVPMHDVPESCRRWRGGFVGCAGDASVSVGLSERLAHLAMESIDDCVRKVRNGERTLMIVRAGSPLTIKSVTSPSRTRA